MRDSDGFAAFLASRQRHFLRTAWMLTGNWATAEDLVQAALAKTWQRWDQITRSDDPEVYVRRVVINTYATWWRRRWRAEDPTAVLPDRPDELAMDTDAVRRLTVLAALRTLPPRQRAVVVLRYFDDLTEAQTADVMGCSIGTIKSQSAKAMSKLRQCPELAPLTEEALT